MSAYFYRIYYEPDRVFPNGRQEMSLSSFEDPHMAFEIGDKIADGRRGWFCDVIDENNIRILDEYGIEVDREEAINADKGQGPQGS